MQYPTMFTTNLSVHAGERGFFELSREALMRNSRTLACDDVMRWCSKLVQDGIFQGPGRICDRKQEKKEQQEQEEKEGDTEEKQGGEKEEEEDEDDPRARAWDENLPKVLSAADAQGFGLATSRRAWRQTLEMVTSIEMLRGLHPMTVHLEPVEGEDMMLHAIDTRLVRVCSSLDSRLWVALPVVLKIKQEGVTPGTIEQMKLNLLRRDTIVDQTTSEPDIGWWIMPESEVYVYMTDSPDVHCGKPVSKVQRQIPERAREQINNSTMSMTNLVNGRPPIPIERKDAGGGRKRLRGEGSGEEEGQSNNHARTGLADDENPMASERAIDATAPRIHDVPSTFNQYTDVRRRQRRDEEKKAETDDWAAEGLMYNPHDAGDVMGDLELKERKLFLREGETIGQTQLPVPPAYYNEQRAHRRYAAAAEWGIPLGVLHNYSMFASSAEGKAGLSALGNKGSGMGGATSSTKSTAWSIWEQTKSSAMSALEDWSVRVLERMWGASSKKRALAHMDSAMKDFDDTEGAFQASIAEDDVEVADGKREERKRNKTRRVDEALSELKAQPSAKWVFRLKRVIPFEEMKQLFVENIVTSEGLLQSAIDRGIPRKFLEKSDAVEKARKSRNEPEPKAGAAGDKAKPKPTE